MKALFRQKHQPVTTRRFFVVVFALILVLAGSSLLALSVGTVSIPLEKVINACTGIGPVSETERLIVIDIRLPRVLLALFVGAGLSIAGAVLQALLRNPLAEPYILGISSGGTMGTILAIALASGISYLIAPLASFAGSACVMVLVYTIAHRRGQLDPFTLLLSGVMVGAFFNAAVLMTVALFNQELRNAFLWLMGNLSGARFVSVAIAGGVTTVAAVPALLMAKQYNLIATGDDAAAQLGVDVRVLRRRSYALASLITGGVVSVSGVVGFVGLIVPHITRMIFGADHRLLLPASFLLGGSFLILADTLARTIIAPAEIPVGAVTAILGAPIFVYLLRRT